MAESKKESKGKNTQEQTTPVTGTSNPNAQLKESSLGRGLNLLIGGESCNFI
jgi:hypothetical protein